MRCEKASKRHRKGIEKASKTGERNGGQAEEGMKGKRIGAVGAKVGPGPAPRGAGRGAKLSADGAFLKP